MWSVDPSEELAYGAIGHIRDGIFPPELCAELLRAVVGSETWDQVRAAVRAEAARAIHQIVSRS
jgi:hypothetical protein